MRYASCVITWSNYYMEKKTPELSLVNSLPVSSKPECLLLFVHKLLTDSEISSVLPAFLEEGYEDLKNIVAILK